eukprot:PhM_4_TR13136/c0_g1_i1/m.95968
MADYVNKSHASLWLIPFEHPVRQLCLQIVRHRWFKALILFSIFLNSVTLAADQPTVTNPSWLTKTLSISELIFTIIFTVEMVLKVVTYGFVLHRHSYLRNGWNVVDFVIVVIAVVSMTSSVQNLSTLRLFRVLRPLRSVNGVPELKKLVTAIFRSMPMVLDNVLLLCFLLIIFAVGGVQLWAGDLHKRCIVIRMGEGTNPAFVPPFLYPPDELPCGGSHTCSAPAGSNITLECGVNWDLYNVEHMNFDVLWSSLLLVFKIMALDNWPDDAEETMDASGQATFIYYFFLTMLGGYFCINLFLAILTNKYTETVQSIEEEARLLAEGAEDVNDMLILVTDDDIKQFDLEEQQQDDEENAAASAAASGNLIMSIDVGVDDPRKQEDALRELELANALMDGDGDDEDNGVPHSSWEADTGSRRSPYSGTFRPAREAVLTRRNSLRERRRSSAMQEHLHAFNQQQQQQQQHSQSSNSSSGAEVGCLVPPPPHPSSPSPETPEEQEPSIAASRGIVAVVLVPPVGDVLDSEHYRPHSAASTGSGSSRARTHHHHHHRPRPLSGELAAQQPHTLSTGGSSNATPYSADSNHTTRPVDDEDENEEDQQTNVNHPLYVEPNGKGVRYALRRFTAHPYTERTVLILTCVSVLCLSVDHYGIDPTLDLALDLVNLILSVIFALEIILKLLGFGPKCLKDRFTTIDLILVLVSIPDMTLLASTSGLNAFRAFRLIRVARLMRRWPSLQMIVRMLLKSVSSVIYLSVLVVLVIYIFAILGMQIFADEFPPSVRTRFSTIWESAITCFVVVSGDSWTDVMRYAMDYSPWLGAIYFLLLYAVGNYILLNLFTAIILDTLDEQQRAVQEAERLLREQEAELRTNIVPRHKTITEMRTKKTAAASSVASSEGLVVSAPSSQPGSPSFDSKEQLPGARQYLDVDQQQHHPRHPLRRRSTKKLSSFVDGDIMSTVNGNDDESNNSKSKNGGWRGVLHTLRILPKQNEDINEDSLNRRPTIVVLPGRSLGLFSGTHPFRVALYKLISHPLFDLTVLSLTFISCVAIGIISTGVSDDVETALSAMNNVISFLFLAELIVKVIACGAWRRPRESPDAESSSSEIATAVVTPYFRDAFNLIDAAVTVTGVLGVFVPFFQLFMVLRVVRLAMRFENLRVVIGALVQAVPYVARGMTLCFFIFFIFGILGVQLFMGRFYHCNDGSVLEKANCVGNFTETTVDPATLFQRTEFVERRWIAETVLFDHIGDAMYVLFVVAVGDGWADIMYRAMDVGGEDVGPRVNHDPAMALYFIVFYILGNFFALNIVLGLLINYFTQLKKEHNGFALLTPQQREYLHCKRSVDRAMFTLTPDPPQSIVRFYAFRVVIGWRNTAGLTPGSRMQSAVEDDDASRTPLFERVITAAILANAVTLAMYHYRIDDTFAAALNTCNIVFTSIFTFEAVVKLVALGPKLYFNDAWNRFDFVVVVVTIVGLFTGMGSGASVVRLLRVGRLLRLIRRAKGLNMLFTTLVEAMPSVLNVMCLLVTLVFVFAVIGVGIFKDVKDNGPLTHNVNFRSLPNAMIALYEISTTEAWADMLDACNIQEPYCSQELGNCGTKFAYLYFILYEMFGAFVMIQLLIAIVIETFTDVEGADKSDVVLRAFVKVKAMWSRHFGSSTQSISCTHFFAFVRAMPPELTALSVDPSRRDMLRTLYASMIPVKRDLTVNYRDIVYGFAFRAFDIDYERAKQLSRFTEILDNIDADVITVAHVFAAQVLSRWFKSRQNRKMKEKNERRPLSPSVRPLHELKEELELSNSNNNNNNNNFNGNSHNSVHSQQQQEDPDMVP